MTSTLGAAIAQHGVDVHPHLDRESLVPISRGVQAQGDLLIVPLDGAPDASTPVPRSGVAIVRGEVGGNTHLLLADGAAYFDGRQASAPDLVLGMLTVPAGSVAFLAHPEHAYSGIGPGTYELRRQREFAGPSVASRRVEPDAGARPRSALLTRLVAD